MRVDLFDFDLPESAIALRPASPRESARLLEIDGPARTDHTVADLVDLLKPGDLLVANDTKVIKAQLEARRVRGDAVARVAVTLHKREGLDRWRAFLRPAKKVKAGDTLHVDDNLTAVAEPTGDGEAVLVFDKAGEALDAAIAQAGSVPIPPYVASRRSADAADDDDYQTVFADEAGAVAAPTAGLHMTPGLLDRLRANGVSVETVTLHVGAGTFLPVKADDTADHAMHSEWGRVTEPVAEAVRATKAKGGRVIALGTTSLRILESSLDSAGEVAPYEGETDIFITPGVRVRSIDMLMTNFHLPRSTLFMLVSALAGLDAMQAAYRHAVETGYRFYSYGDACLIHNRSDA